MFIGISLVANQKTEFVDTNKSKCNFILIPRGSINDVIAEANCLRDIKKIVKKMRSLWWLRQMTSPDRIQDMTITQKMQKFNYDI